jgi:hypothetical protein
MIFENDFGLYVLDAETLELQESNPVHDLTSFCSSTHLIRHRARVPILEASHLTHWVTYLAKVERIKPEAHD